MGGILTSEEVVSSNWSHPRGVCLKRGP